MPPIPMISSGTRALAAALFLALAPVPAAAQLPTLPRADSLARVPAAPADPARPVRLCAGGDVTLGTNLPTFSLRDTMPGPLRRDATRAERRAHAAAVARARRPRVDTIPSSWTAAPERLLAPLRPLVRDADVVLVNVEGAIGEGRTASKCGPRSTLCFAFRMPPAAAPALRALAGDSAAVVGNVANNHARDAGPAGFDSTVAHLARAGVVAAGADTLPALAVTAAGDTVAILGFATSGPGTPDVRDLDAVRRHVRRAAERWPRLVVTMHIGSEGVAAQRTRDTTETLAGGSRGNPVAFARAVVESGADLVVGHGPHVLRAGEWRGEVPVFYSLGNLVTYGPFSNRAPIDRGAVLCATLEADGRARDLQLRPTRQRTPGDLVADDDGRAIALVDSLSRLDFPETGVRVGRDGRVAPRPGSVSRRAR